MNKGIVGDSKDKKDMGPGMKEQKGEGERANKGKDAQ